MPSGIFGSPSVPVMSPGINQGMPGGVPPVPLAPPGPEASVAENPLAASALAALDNLLPKSNANPTESIAKVNEALELAHQLVLRALPQVTTWNAKLAQTLHGVARQLLSAKVELQREADSFAPPPPLGMGMTPGMPGVMAPAGPTGGGY